MAKNWKIRTDLSIEVCGHTLFRIECTQDFKEIKAGTLGGFIEKEENLDGDAWVSDDARVYGNAKVSDDALVYGNARVYGNAWVCGDARVYGNAWVYDDAQVCGDAWVCGDAQVCGDARVCGDAQVCGDARVCGDKITNKDDICYISNRYYNITITPLHIKIGCQYHAQEAWWNFTDEQIGKMDGESALNFWKIWKEPLKQICDAMKKEKGEKDVK